ncbi:MAG TPA: hypothetical protein VJ716_02310, partial [Gaiellaceae bacterium]|nr:hypothetical protein [Gaiellaceae bacterium]
VPARAPERPRRPRQPVRSRRRRPLVWALLALVAAGVAFAAVLLLGGASHHHSGAGSGGSSGSTVQLHGVGNYNPSTLSTDSHANTAAAATDGDPSTPWITQIYSSPEFGGLMAPYNGLGLVLDASRPVKLQSLTVHSPTPGFRAEIRSGSSQSGPFSSDSAAKTVGSSTTFALNGATAQYYVVWITSLAGTTEGYMARISEVTAKS